jgi:hypothetical protein
MGGTSRPGIRTSAARPPAGSARSADLSASMATLSSFPSGGQGRGQIKPS